MELAVDDLFDSKLEPESFDLVHARYVIAPLGRGREQVASHRRLLRPGGSLVLEAWDLGSWHFNPHARAAERLIRLLSEIFAARGGEAGRGLPELLCEIGIEEPEIDAHVIALKPGHPSLRLPLQFSVALEARLLETLSEDELASLRREADGELVEPGRWGPTFTVIQSWADSPDGGGMDLDELAFRPWPVQGARDVLTFVRGFGSHVIDADGCRYLDFSSQDQSACARRPYTQKLRECLAAMADPWLRGQIASNRSRRCVRSR